MAFTEKVPITTGSQGSYFCYILIKNSSVAMFADDTTLITSGKQIDKILKVDICQTSKWLACNKLTNNIDKCEQCFLVAVNHSIYSLTILSSLTKTRLKF